MSKARIYEFDPVIYPRKLWVAKGGTKEDIKEVFLNDGGEEIDFGDRQNVEAYAISVERKEDLMQGALVWFPSAITIKLMCHEATHALFFLCRALDMDLFINGSNEHFAYLMGWICDCIDKVRTNKETNKTDKDLNKKTK